ncbi:YkvI family membrane protein [Paenibacillus eucommiae]|uniref:Membrane protein YkvI n=1 Tax=Paenibacillus eucommiae TaxID=1355755 RepID=A0ABS4IVZ1_9BACL|nr:hypothetical protein [Paenibacillus eucommiae]MBP1991240.1 putative membrane protein YkvI [Paenibacillus eucommiae]
MGKRMQIVQVASTYIGTVVGAGFASGQEILQFFTFHGTLGLAGIIVTTGLFAWIGTKMMVLAHRIQANSYHQMNTYLFGQTWGRVISLFIFVILLGVTSVMLASTGAIVEEQLGFPFQWGILFTITLSFLVLIKGMKGLLSINLLVMPMMLGFTLLVASQLGLKGFYAEVYAYPDHGKWLFHSITYAAFNLAMVQAVLVPLGSEIKDESVLKWGGLLGSLTLGLMLSISHMALHYHMPQIWDFAIPMAEIIRNLGNAVRLLFLVVVFGEVFTTLVGNVFGMTRQIQQVYPIPQKLIVLLLLFGCLLIGQIGYSSLLSALYPVFGYMGLFLMVSLMFKRMPAKS